jgi:hypothetical protein
MIFSYLFTSVPIFSNTDGYAAYNGVNPKERQSCLAHLIRKSKEIKQEILLRKSRFQDKRSIVFCDSRHIEGVISQVGSRSKRSEFDGCFPKLVAQTIWPWWSDLKS